MFYTILKYKIKISENKKIITTLLLSINIYSIYI